MPRTKKSILFAADLGGPAQSSPGCADAVLRELLDDAPALRTKRHGFSGTDCLVPSNRLAKLPGCANPRQSYSGEGWCVRATGEYASSCDLKRKRTPLRGSVAGRGPCGFCPGFRILRVMSAMN